MLAALLPAIDRWRGLPYEDVAGHEWLDFERIRLGTLYIRASLRAGELLAADRELDHAEVMARRVVMADPQVAEEKRFCWKCAAAVGLSRRTQSRPPNRNSIRYSPVALRGTSSGSRTPMLSRLCLWVVTS